MFFEDINTSRSGKMQSTLSQDAENIFKTLEILPKRITILETACSAWNFRFKLFTHLTHFFLFTEWLRRPTCFRVFLDQLYKVALRLTLRILIPSLTLWREKMRKVSYLFRRLCIANCQSREGEQVDIYRALGLSSSILRSRKTIV